MIRGKKGIFFTLSAIVLLVSVFFMSRSFLVRQADMQEIVSRTLISEKMNFLADDIADFTYAGIYIDIARDNSITTVNLSGTTIDSIDPQARLDDYFDFIMTNFSRLNNFQIEVFNMTPVFSVTPLNLTAFFFSDGIQVINAKYANLQSIEIDLYTDKLNPVSNYSPTDSGNVNVTVRIFDALNNQVLTDTFAQLSPSIDNQEFFVLFQDGTEVFVDFGVHGGYDGILSINATGANVTLENFVIKYLNTKPVQAFTAGDMLIKTYDISPVKRDLLVLASN